MNALTRQTARLIFILVCATASLHSTESTKGAPFDSITFVAADGRTVDLAQMRGKVVLLDFWAMWCGPCIRELFSLKPLHEKYHASGFEIVGIYCDKGSASELKSFLDKQGMTWPQYFGGEIKESTSVAHRFGIFELPTTFLIGRDGKVIGRNIRGAALEPALRQALGL